MKKLLLPVLYLTFFMLVLHSCKKNFADEQYKPADNPDTPDLAVMITTSVAGFIVDENDKPVYNAVVSAGSQSVSTDEFGYFAIKNASLSKTAGFIKVSKAGYFFGYKTFIGKEGAETFVRLKLITKANTGDADAAAGGTVTTANGATVTLPAGGVVVAAGGATYTGPVHVAIRNIDPSNINTAPMQLPGDGRGIDNTGHLKQLHSFGTLAVELTGASGELLQIATGKQATIKIPIPASIASSAPASISLWSFNEVNGLWKEESTATRSGNFYTGNVSHFSFWEGATGQQMVNFSVQVTDAALHPLANVAVVITGQGQPYNAGYGSFGFTDASGFVQGPVYANSSMVLEVMTPCNIPVYTHNFTTTGSNYDMGTITGNLGQNTATLTGTVKNCSNAPVTDGYIQTYDNGFYNRINITNGTFNFTGIFCTNGPTNVVAVDNTTHQQNVPQVINLVAGVNNLGTITACGTSTLSTITYTIDGVAQTFSDPLNPFRGYFTSNITQVVEVSSSQNTNPHISFQFDGGTAIGNAHGVSEIFSVSFPGGRGVATPALPVGITEYGDVGGFISGSFSGTVLDFTPTPAPHTISCSFRIRRMN
jgi:hypothetical protein